jgi:hypothetical protein
MVMRSVLAGLAAVVALISGQSAVTAAEISRVVRVTDTVKNDIAVHRAEMAAELKSLGCERGRLTGFSSRTNPARLVLVMTCVQEADSTGTGQLSHAKPPLDQQR